MADTAAGLAIEFESLTADIRPLRFTVTNRGKFHAVRERLDHGLTAVKDLVHELDIDDSRLVSLAQALGEMGRRMLLTLVGNSPTMVRALQDFWTAAIPAWRNPHHTAVVECVGDAEHLLPLEFFPFFDLGIDADEITDRNDFTAWCRSFIGFSCVVRRRIIPVVVAEGSELLFTLPDGRISLSYWHYESLPGARREYEWLVNEATEGVLVHGPRPGPGQNVADIAGAIYDPAGEQIQHFSCHCDTTADDPFDYRLALQDSGTDIEVTLGELGDHLIRSSARHPRRATHMPLVVLNACGSSRVDSKSSLSFPNLFLENGNRACVATEITVPDQDAAEISVAFYRELLTGVDVGTAMHRARTHVLRKHGNPLGLAYTVYGNTDLTIDL
ncbi:CHAT domain-containing protein [Nocardia sp. NPDC003345]